MQTTIDTRSTKELDNKTRFEYELDFLQSLANPYYIQYLASRKHLQNPALIHFLKYLQYWKQPQYIKYIQYPACLYYLDKLQNELFRQSCEDPNTMNDIIFQHHCHFDYYKTNRTPSIPRVVDLKQTPSQN